MGPRSASEAELRVMEVLWGTSELTVREVAESLYGAGATPVQYRTVQVQLDRLEKKGLVARNRDRFPQVFRPTVARDQFLGGELKALADQLCDGSLTPLLMQLVQDVRLSDRERDDLRRLLEDTEDVP